MPTSMSKNVGETKARVAFMSLLSRDEVVRKGPWLQKMRAPRC